ncbi:hypothetical protein BJ508DRAFT_419574 [Ascobolus immersus RN42]|uniref:Cora-domain-containing protein n=1 Tax=Ascobolus immersus RN42 TaxID=1160509 RepID=A0A3N4HGK2_ASCIM|nr:hypothetical protein BJ508DRAFT_419574 [Ascobolus immersus RN42]
MGHKKRNALDIESSTAVNLDGTLVGRWIQYPKEGVPRILETSTNATDRLKGDRYEPYNPEILEIAYSQWQNDKNGKLRARLVETSPDHENTTFKWIHFKSKDPASTAKDIASPTEKDNIYLFQEEKFLFDRLKDNLDVVQDRQYQMLTQGGAWDIRTWFEDQNGLPHYAKTSCIPFHSRSFKCETAKPSRGRFPIRKANVSWREMYGPKQTDKTSSLVTFCSRTVLVTVAPCSREEMMGKLITIDNSKSESTEKEVDPDSSSVIRVITEHGHSYVFPIENCKTWFALLCFVRASCFRDRLVDIETCRFFLRGKDRIEINALNWYQKMVPGNRIVLDLDLEESKNLPIILDAIPATSSSSKPRTYELPEKHQSKRLFRAYKKYQNMNFFVGHTRDASEFSRFQKRQTSKIPVIITAEPDSFENDDLLTEGSRFGEGDQGDSASVNSMQSLQQQLVSEFQTFAADLVMDMAQQVATKLLQAQLPSSDMNTSGHIDTRLDTTNGHFDWIASFGRVEYPDPGLSTSRILSPHTGESQNLSNNAAVASTEEVPQIQPLFTWPLGYARIREQMKRFSVSAGLRLTLPGLPFVPDADHGGSFLQDVSDNLDDLITNLLDPDVFKALAIPLRSNATGVDQLLSFKRKQLVKDRSQLPLTLEDSFVTSCESLYRFFFPQDHKSYASLVYWASVQKITEILPTKSYDPFKTRLIKEMRGLLEDVLRTAGFIRSGVQQHTSENQHKECKLGRFYVIPKALPDAFLVLVQYLATVRLLLDSEYLETLVDEVPDTQPSRSATMDTSILLHQRSFSQDSSFSGSKELRAKIRSIERQKNYLDGKLITLMRKGCDQLISMDAHAYKRQTENCDSPNTESLILQIIQSLLERNYEVDKTSFQTSLSRTNRMTGAGIDQTEMHMIRGQLKEVITARNVLSQQMQVLDSFQRNSDWSGRSFEHLLECTATARMNKALLKRTREIVSRQLGEIEKFESRFRQEFERASRIVELNKETSEVALMVFTTVTTIFLPLSVVTGYFGMNTSDIRDMTAGSGIFWKTAVPIVVLFVVVTVPFAFYWRSIKKFLQRLWDFTFGNIARLVLTKKIKES